MTGFDTRNPKFNSIKYRRQLRAAIRWMKSGARATVEAATGLTKKLLLTI